MAGYAVAEVIVPTEEQTVLCVVLPKYATVFVQLPDHLMRQVMVDTYYTVPQREHSLFRGSSNEDCVAFVFDGKPMESDPCSECINSSPSTKKLERDTLTLVTYDGSSEKQKRQLLKDLSSCGRQTVASVDGDI